ncbi:MAG: hypothetical protein JXA67_19205 [Micromonosporaceae bacterium]|nr:hypothetical protein [Micromonosporaceae bacterium]
MSDPTTVDHGFVHVDTGAWVDQRVGDKLQELTSALSDFGHHDLFREYPMDRVDPMTRAELWCVARGFGVDEGQPVEHDDEVLTRPVSILCAATDTREAIAVVSVDGGEPTVYPDRTTDPGYWHQDDQVDIACTECAERWTWCPNTDNALVHGCGACHESSIADIFGTGDGSPFAPCTACAAVEAGDPDASCDGDHEPAIVCPTCGADCQLRLTDVPVCEVTPPAV